VRLARRIVPVVAAALLAACGGAPDAPAPETAPAPAEAAAPETGATAAPAEPLRPVRVRVYFPSADATDLVGEDREIFDTAAPGDRAKQILSDLIEGPESGAAVPAVPRGVRLRQVYVLADGTAWADFSVELRDLAAGGSAEELTTVYAIVDSVALNVREIRRLGILIEGEEVDTLTGHLDLRRPLAPRTDLIRGARR